MGQTAKASDDAVISRVLGIASISATRLLGNDSSDPGHVIAAVD